MIHFSQDSTKIAVIILTFAVLGYTTFLLYKDSVSIKQEIVKIKQQLDVVTEQIENAGNLFEQPGSFMVPQSDSDTGSDTETGSVYSDDNDILENLQDISSTIEESQSQSSISDKDDDSATSFHRGSEDVFDPSEIEPEESIFLFKKSDISDEQNKTKQKCCFVLKSGKRKGLECSLKALGDTDLCKNHSGKI